MGRKRKNKQQPPPQQQESRNSKRRRKQQQGRGGRGRGSYWIQDCPDLLPFQDEEPSANGHQVGAVAADSASLLIWISAAHLKDGHPSSQLQYSKKGPKQKSADAEGEHDHADEQAERSRSSDSTEKASNNHREVVVKEDDNRSEQRPSNTEEAVVAVNWRPKGAFLVESETRCSNTCSGTTSTCTSVERTSTVETGAQKCKSETDVFEDASSQVQTTHSQAVHESPEFENQEKYDETKVDDDPVLPSLPAIYIQREPPPQSPQAKTRQRNNRHHFRHLPNGDCGDGILNPYDPLVVQDKYWAQRHRLFSKFDRGVQLDADGWFSVTPEAIAEHIARRMATLHNNDAASGRNNNLVVLDAFCGVGGNTIALAQEPRVSLVLAVDTCPDRLRLAANNCRVYSIPPSKVLFVHGDACDILNQYNHGRHVVGGTASEEEDAETVMKEKNAKAKEDTTTTKNAERGTTVNVDSAALTFKETTDDEANTSVNNHGYTIVSGTDDAYNTLLPSHLDAIFLSPPWGGSDYEQIGARHYSLDCIRLADSGVDGVQLLRQSLAALPPNRLNVAYFLPRNLNGLTFAQNCYDCGVRGCVELEQNVLNQKLKTITVYINSSNNSNNDSSSRGDR